MVRLTNSLGRCCRAWQYPPVDSPIFLSWTRLHWLSSGSNRPSTNWATLLASVPRGCSRCTIIIHIIRRAV